MIICLALRGARIWPQARREDVTDVTDVDADVVSEIDLRSRDVCLQLA